jgi:hypothetical protein
MIRSAQNWLYSVPLSIKRDSADVEFMYARSVLVQHRWQELYIKGNPKDWIERTYQGGTVVLQGLFTPSSGNILSPSYVDIMTVGPFVRLFACRPSQINLQFEGIAQGISGFSGSIAYTFETFDYNP